MPNLKKTKTQKQKPTYKQKKNNKYIAYFVSGWKSLNVEAV